MTIPDPGTKGGFSIVTFSVPNERDDAGTTKVEVQLPKDSPLPFVSVQPKPGWTAKTTMRKLDKPIEAFGDSYDEVVDTVTWSGGQIEAGQFDTFSLSVGPLPDDVDALAFPTIQTYSSGEEVAWIQATPANGEEPEHPAPTLQLVAGEAEGTDGGVATTTTASSSSKATTDDGDDRDDGTDPVAIAALVVAVLAALLGAGALLTARSKAA
ncbi:YcnI family protein [Aquihabitans sp. G128]|uniref:YcnI family copper-binding membrane protein n=1 Tax=Aquihabitans sp. G128 TaxID=2849779 RepID=UPI001C22672F|nr:YcnI family protein [Aquihabitans sp. G128]QXC62353.1 YcnI family protein [Aquihabitans sp. G128]